MNSISTVNAFSFKNNSKLKNFKNVFSFWTTNDEPRQRFTKLGRRTEKQRKESKMKEIGTAFVRSKTKEAKRIERSCERRNTAKANDRVRRQTTKAKRKTIVRRQTKGSRFRICVIRGIWDWRDSRFGIQFGVWGTKQLLNKWLEILQICYLTILPRTSPAQCPPALRSFLLFHLFFLFPAVAASTIAIGFEGCQHLTTHHTSRIAHLPMCAI